MYYLDNNLLKRNNPVNNKYALDNNKIQRLIRLEF